MRHTDKASTLRILLWLSAYLLGGLGLAIPAAAQTCGAPYTTIYSYLTPGGLLAGKISPAPSGQGNLPAIRYSYDSNGRLQKVETGYLSSCPSGQLPSQWSGFQVGKTIVYSYDGNGNKTLEVVTGTYNSAGVTTNVTQYSYDGYDRLTCAAVRMNPSAFSSLPASACTLGTQGSDGPDRITENYYDYLNRLTNVQKGVGTANQETYATYTYTADSLQQYITDADGNESELTYDGFDRLAYWYFPSKTSANTVDASDYEAYGYDANGNRTSLRKRDEETIVYHFDALNHMWLKEVPNASQDVYYGYDLRGLMTYAVFGSTSGPGITNIVYDGFGRQTSATNTMGGVSRTVGQGFDNDGDRTSVTFPDANYFDYDYDGLDRLSDVRENGTATIVSENYYPIGLLSGETRGGVTSSYGYDPAERPQSSADSFASPGPNVSTTLGYNAADQINSRTRDNDAYAYTGYSNGSTAYVPNGLNQYASVAGTTFGYDANGNLTSDGSTTYGYDVENRLISASGAYHASLIYDPLGRLFEVSTSSGSREFLYAGDQLIAEYDGSSGALLHRYVQGPGGDDPLIWYKGASVSSSNRWSLQEDYKGSIQSVGDASGKVIAINRYDEYGAPEADNLGTFQYTGQAWEPEVGLYYYKARMYNPRLGRFMQTDPVGYKDDLDLYAYVHDDPIDGTDPTGECEPVSCADLAAGNWSSVTGPHELTLEDKIGLAVVGGILTDGVADLAGAGSLLARAAQGIRSLFGAARGISAADRLARNVAQSKTGEAMTRAKLGDRIAGEQVTFRTSTGQAARPDFVTTDKEVVETKTGNADLSPGQAQLKSDVDAGRPVTPVGGNAEKAGLTPGEPIKMKCFQVDRPC